MAHDQTKDQKRGQAAFCIVQPAEAMGFDGVVWCSLHRRMRLCKVWGVEAQAKAHQNSYRKRWTSLLCAGASFPLPYFLMR